MAYGEVYVEVDASVIGGGIMPMALVSGNPEPVAGQESFGVWLRWQYDDATGAGGFTGGGWYFDDIHNAINKKYETEEEFKAYLVEKKPTDLNDVLGTWDPTDKGRFFTNNQSALGTNNCFSFGSGS